MLESIRKKKETQEQLKTLENRIRRLKEEENLTLIKQKTQQRQIENILKIRMQAYEEKQQQRLRKEIMIREIEQRRAKVSKEKDGINMGRVKSVRRHEGEIQKLVNELRSERKVRSIKIIENRERVLQNNQQVTRSRVRGVVNNFINRWWRLLFNSLKREGISCYRKTDNSTC